MYNRQREKKADDFFFLVSKVKTRLSFCCPNKNGMNSFLVHIRRENDRTVLVNRIKENKKKENERFLLLTIGESELAICQLSNTNEDKSLIKLFHFFFDCINRRFHRAWMKFADRLTRDIQCLVQIVVDSSFQLTS
jgi:hypothetical protein